MRTLGTWSDRLFTFGSVSLGCCNAVVAIKVGWISASWDIAAMYALLALVAMVIAAWLPTDDDVTYKVEIEYRTGKIYTIDYQGSSAVLGKIMKMLNDVEGIENLESITEVKK